MEGHGLPNRKTSPSPSPSFRRCLAFPKSPCLKPSCSSGVAAKAGPPAASGSGDELPGLRLATLAGCNLKSDNPQQRRAKPRGRYTPFNAFTAVPAASACARKQQRDKQCMPRRRHSKASAHLTVRDEGTSLKSKERLEQQSTASAQNSPQHLPLHLLAWARTAMMISTTHRLTDSVLSFGHTLPSCGWKAVSPLMPSSRSDLMMKYTLVCSSARTARNIKAMQRPMHSVGVPGHIITFQVAAYNLVAGSFQLGRHR